MVGELITLPVRLGVRATRLWLRVTEETLGLAVNAGIRVISVTARNRDAGTATLPREPVRPSPSEPSPSEPSSPEPSSPEPRHDAETEAVVQEAADAVRPRADEPPAPSHPYETPPEAEPVHVSEEPALVEEVAEPGAEEGAGAEVHVDEPWDGYAKLNAREIVARLGSSTPAELAAVQLYEASHRRRQTVLNTVERELRTANGRGSRTQ